MTRPYVVTISSEKGGVGKTTLATNLAIFFKAVAEEVPVTLLSFDNHFSVDRMFRIGRGKGRGDASALFTGTPPLDLVEMGEFGVQFIASCPNLSPLRETVKEPDVLARALADSGLEGVVIIDTRPDLDIFTQNALYAADRVIVPVKDAPSLENTRHLYDFFEAKGLARSTLRILPCLIDFRIQYEGPFRDPHQLMKAYAINRGYRCLEGCISKSPKVESLNTNPEGKIYPVLTHGRGTEVHAQFARLAETLLEDFQQGKDRRADQVAREMEGERSLRDRAFLDRRGQVAKVCLICGAPLFDGEHLQPRAAFYAETSDGRTTGYIEEECFGRMVFQQIYQSRSENGAPTPLWDLFRESAQRCYFALRRAPGTRGFYEQQLSFYRFDEEGLEISHKVVPLPPAGTTPAEGPAGDLSRLLERTLFDSEGRLGDAFLLVRRVSSDFPEEILYEEHYAPLKTAVSRITPQLP